MTGIFALSRSLPLTSQKTAEDASKMLKSVKESIKDRRYEVVTTQNRDDPQVITVLDTTRDCDAFLYQFLAKFIGAPICWNGNMPANPKKSCDFPWSSLVLHSARYENDKKGGKRLEIFAVGLDFNEPTKPALYSLSSICSLWVRQNLGKSVSRNQLYVFFCSVPIYAFVFPTDSVSFFLTTRKRRMVMT